MFVVVAATYDAARRAARLAKVDYEVLPPVLTPQEAKRLQSYVLPPMHLQRGDADTAMAAAPRRMGGEFYVRFKLRLDKMDEPLALEGVWQPVLPAQTEMKKQIAFAKVPECAATIPFRSFQSDRMNVLCLDVRVPL